MDLDELDDQLGSLSLYKLFVIFSCLLCVFAATLTPQTGVYYNAVPSHRCKLPDFEEAILLGNVSEEYITSFAIPPGDSCHQYRYNLTNCLESENSSCLVNASSNGIIECDNGYYYDKTYFEETLVSEWDLVCNRSILNSVLNSILFVGIFFGSPPAGYIVDWFGRRLAMLVLSVGLVVSGIVCSFAPNLVVYGIFRFIEGATSVPLCGAVFSYANEIANRRIRATVSTVVMFTTTICHTVFPLMAYCLRDWRDLNLASALLSLAFIITWPFIPESPKWLLMKGKEKEARKVMNRYARSKGKTLDNKDWQNVLYTEKKKMEFVNTRAHLIDIFRRPFTRIVSLVVMFDWFAVNCVFYGLVLNVGTLLGDPYLNGTLNGATEIVAIFVYIAVTKKFGAKGSLVVGMLCAGSCCLVAMITGQIDSTSEVALQIVRWTSISGKLFASVAFYATYQYTNDVFPVITRGKAMALASTCARIGSMSIPFVLEVQSEAIWITQAIFGILGLSAGLATLILPNASTKVVTTTLQEAEKNYCTEMKWIAKFIRKTVNAEDMTMETEALNIELDTGSRDDKLHLTETNPKV